jgi:uncharacterized membrane protein YphA (DoxX/SURF4 family)
MSPILLAVGPLAVVVAEPLRSLAPVAAVTVAGVFVVAAVAKLIDPDRTGQDFAALGLPAPALLARVVPPAELVVAAALLTHPPLGAMAAVAALLGFTIVLARVIASGRTVTCGCLGSFDRRPVGPMTLARNGVLTALAAVAAASPVPDGLAPVLPRPEVAMTVGLVVLLTALAAQLMVLRVSLGHLWAPVPVGEAAGAPTGRSTNDRTTMFEKGL